MKDEKLRYAVERTMEILGEAASRLSTAAMAAVDVNWQGIRGLRNLLAHDYRGILPSRLYNIIKNDLPDLLGKVERALQDPRHTL